MSTEAHDRVSGSIGLCPHGIRIPSLSIFTRGIIMQGGDTQLRRALCESNISRAQWPYYIEWTGSFSTFGVSIGANYYNRIIKLPSQTARQGLPIHSKARRHVALVVDSFVRHDARRHRRCIVAAATLARFLAWSFRCALIP